MSEMKLISRELLDSLSAAARALPRQRKNLNFHQRDDAVCHRLLDALEPQTYIAPHRHRDENKGESLAILRGKIGVLIFFGDGKIARKFILTPMSDCFGVDISPGTIHSLVALEKDSVFFESKAGPYVPLAQNERFDWAPSEGTDGVADYLAWMKSQFVLG